MKIMYKIISSEQSTSLLDIVNNNVSSSKVKTKYSRSELKSLIQSPTKAGTRSPPLLLSCDLCHEIFYSKWSWQKHTKSKHPEKTFTCKECPDSFLYQSNLIKHMKEKHSDKVKCKDVKKLPFSAEVKSDFSIQCSECSKGFSSKVRILFLCFATKIRFVFSST